MCSNHLCLMYPLCTMLQAVIVQLSCMAYQFYLLQKCNVSHMRMFSVFLSLPSATVSDLATGYHAAIPHYPLRKGALLRKMPPTLQFTD